MKTKRNNPGAAPAPMSGASAHAMSNESLEGMCAVMIRLVLERLLSAMSEGQPYATPEMLTAAQFAERWGDITPHTVERWCRDGRLPYAISREKAGWRIPSFYLWADAPPAHLRHLYVAAQGGSSDHPESSASSAGTLPPADRPRPSAELREMRRPKVTSDGFDVSTLLGRGSARASATPNRVTPKRAAPPERLERPTRRRRQA